VTERGGGGPFATATGADLVTSGVVLVNAAGGRASTLGVCDVPPGAVPADVRVLDCIFAALGSGGGALLGGLLVGSGGGFVGGFAEG
jgi:hypothetical protein